MGSWSTTLRAKARGSGGGGGAYPSPAFAVCVFQVGAGPDWTSLPGAFLKAGWLTLGSGLQKWGVQDRLRPQKLEKRASLCFHSKHEMGVCVQMPCLTFATRDTHTSF